MCLQLEIELPVEYGAGRISARRLSRETGLRVSGYHTADRVRRFHFARGKECSCSLLGDKFEVHSEEWPLEPDAASAFAKAVALVAEAVPSFTVRSVWGGGEEDPRHLTTTVGQLLNELQHDRLVAHAIRLVLGIREDRLV